MALAAPLAVMRSVLVCQGLDGPSLIGGFHVVPAPRLGAAQPASSAPLPAAVENDFSFNMGLAMKLRLQADSHLFYSPAGTLDHLCIVDKVQNAPRRFGHS